MAGFAVDVWLLRFQWVPESVVAGHPPAL